MHQSSVLIFLVSQILERGTTRLSAKQPPVSIQYILARLKVVLGVPKLLLSCSQI